MAKCSPYHTTSSEDRDVYHDHDDCPDGRRIKQENRVPGTGGRPRCKECRHLG